jgi:very-short-patch-repair endonuclease
MQWLCLRPPEINLIRLLGGRVIMIPIPNRTTAAGKYCLVDYGKYLESELVKSHVMVGDQLVDFAIVNKFYRRGIIVNDPDYYANILHQVARQEYFAAAGWDVLFINPNDIKIRPGYVILLIKKHLTK